MAVAGRSCWPEAISVFLIDKQCENGRDGDNQLLGVAGVDKRGCYRAFVSFTPW